MSMRLTQVRGLPVVDPRSAKKVGTISGVYVDAQSARIAAFDVKAAGTNESLQISADCVRRVGVHAVMLAGSMDLFTLPDMEDEGLIDSQTLIGLEVMGETGNRLGTLCDALFNQDTLQVDQFEMAVPSVERWFGSGGRISPDAVIACSPELMVVRAGKRVLELEESNGSRALPEHALIGAERDGHQRAA